MKEKERLRNTNIFFLRIEQESNQNGRFQKEETKIENEKKKENGETEKRKTLGKTSKNDIFFEKSNGVKKRGDTELECKTSVKHNSKFFFKKKNIFKKLSYICGRKRKSTKGIKKKKQVDISIRRVFLVWKS